MTASRIPQFYLLLKAVADIKDRKAQRILLKRLARNKEFRMCIKEIAANIVNQSLKLTKGDKRRLNKHSILIRHLVKERCVAQSGGFLNIAVPLLATVVGELIAAAARK